MRGKTVVITGANSGIGYATAESLAVDGAEVVLLCRNAAKAQAAMDRIRSRAPSAQLHFHPLDLASFASVRAAAESVLEAHPRIDVLVNNAGLYMPRRALTEDGLETTVQVNHFAPFLLTSLLADRIRASAPARIVNVSSAAHRSGTVDLDDLQSERRYRGLEAYGVSKTMNILHVRSLARRLDPGAVTANALHPGVVASNFGQASVAFRVMFFVLRPILKSSRQGAATTLHLVRSPEGGQKTGRYFADAKEARPLAQARDDALAEQVWEKSERLTGAPPWPLPEA